MSPRGRPTSEPKNHETRIRMSDEDIRLLEICCQKTGMTKADVIRQGIREVYEKINEGVGPPDKHTNTPTNTIPEGLANL